MIIESIILTFLRFLQHDTQLTLILVNQKVMNIVLMIFIFILMIGKSICFLLRLISTVKIIYDEEESKDKLPGDIWVYVITFSI